MTQSCGTCHYHWNGDCTFMVEDGLPFWVDVYHATLPDDGTDCEAWELRRTHCSECHQKLAEVNQPA